MPGKRKAPEGGREDVWTDKQVRALRDNVGVAGWSVVQKKCGARSRGAVVQKLRRTFGGGGITRGTYQLAEAMEETGYSRTQLKRAADALNQRWLRTKKRGAFLITGEQLEEMAEWLCHDYWSKPKELYCCVQCGTDQQEHHRFGLCLRCYHRFRRRALRLDMPTTASGLLALLGSQSEDFRLQRIRTNLMKGRAPTLDDLEFLCTSSKQ